MQVSLSKQWQNISAIETETIVSIRAIYGDIWCCIGQTTRIQIFDVNFGAKGTLKMPLENHYVSDVSKRDEEHVFVATHEGIHVFRKTGWLFVHVLLIRN